MFNPNPTPPSPHQQPNRPNRWRPPASRALWIGVAGTAIVALIGLLSGGFWAMLAAVAAVALFTAAYGFIFGRRTWAGLPRKRSVAAITVGIAFIVMIGSTGAAAATYSGPSTGDGQAAVIAASVSPTQSAPSPSRTHTVHPKASPTPTPTPTPVITTQTVTETSPVPFQSTTVQSATMASGTSSVTTTGVNGVETKTYTVTYSDGTETGRVLTSDTVTTQPVTQVTTVGTYVAPPAPAAPAAPAQTCTNGTYVNSAGNTVCSPEVSSSAPSGATAKCKDGTYSFSQSRRGTCSSHGGVAAWL